MVQVHGIVHYARSKCNINTDSVYDKPPYRYSTVVLKRTGQNIYVYNVTGVMVQVCCTVITGTLRYTWAHILCVL